MLLVDDSELTHKVLKHRFGMFGWTLASVYDGQQAVERFQSDNFAGIDMVLMDLSMPVMDGRRAIRALLEMGCQIPIFVLTAARGNVTVGGAAGVLCKPLLVPLLIEQLLRACKPTGKPLKPYVINVERVKFLYKNSCNFKIRNISALWILCDKMHRIN